jgi:amino acid transporter
LKLAALSFVSIFLSFILACFCFNLSAKDKGEKQLNKVAQIVLIVIFLVVLIVGIFLAALLETPKLPHRDIVVP